MAIVQPAQVPLEWAGSLLREVQPAVGAPLKSFTTIPEQIKLLESRGLHVEEDQAHQWLSSVGYYRLSGYWYPYRELTQSRKHVRGDRFVSGATFDDVVKLYELDRKLRTLIHDAIERIEVTLRSHVSAYLGSFGALAYEDPVRFRPSFDHAQWLSRARRRADRAKGHSEPIRHHDQKYGGKLPIWVLTEVLDFADVSMLYEGLPALPQRRIAEDLGFVVDLDQLRTNQARKARKTHPLVRWFEHLTIIRNTAAHHSRTWNRSFAPVPTPAMRTISALESLPEHQSERIYGALTVMAHMLARISPGTSWTSKVRTLVADSLSALPGRSPAEMGFPEGWRSLPVWHPPSGSA